MTSTNPEQDLKNLQTALLIHAHKQGSDYPEVVFQTVRPNETHPDPLAKTGTGTLCWFDWKQEDLQKTKGLDGQLLPIDPQLIQSPETLVENMKKIGWEEIPDPHHRSPGVGLRFDKTQDPRLLKKCNIWLAPGEGQKGGATVQVDDSIVRPFTKTPPARLEEPNTIEGSYTIR